MRSLHVGIIMDGNRRYAKSKGMDPWEGHKEGVLSLEKIIEASIDLGIAQLTLYTFSTENFKRSKQEISKIMQVFRWAFKKIYSGDSPVSLDDIKIRFLGQRQMFPRYIQELMKKLELRTKSSTKLIVNFAMAYGGRLEIVDAVKTILSSKDSKEEITEDIISKNLYLHSDIDIVIRTGGEKRLSNFFPWQCTYAELFFTDTFWPAFTKEELKKIITNFSKRNRRFGS